MQEKFLMKIPLAMLRFHVFRHTADALPNESFYSHLTLHWRLQNPY
ncbi:MAG TPA: hypothetical protein V6D25_13420 [Leptolyngbyaceae cyanobacterium]